MLNNDNGILRSIEKPPGIMHDRLCMVNNQYRIPTTNVNISNNTRMVPINGSNVVRDLSTDHLDAPRNDEQEFSNLNIIPSLISERHRKAVFVENLVDTARYSGQNNDPATCGRRMFLASLIIASKYLQDRNYSNRAWAKISGLSVHEVNANEVCFLKLIDYNLFITEDVFKRWSSLLLTHIQAISGPEISSPDAFRKAENQNAVSVFCETLRSMDSTTFECKQSNLDISPITPAASTPGSPISILPNSLIEKMENTSLNAHESELKMNCCIHCKQPVSIPHLCNLFEHSSQSSTQISGIGSFLDKQRVLSSPVST
ncbi:5967_t:CDS:2, partial [Racocetra fulgida]